MSKEEFEKKIHYLAKHYKMISLEKAVKYLRENKRPENCIALTFDDGYKCLYTTVFPILKKYNIPATVFIATNFVDSGNLLWHDRIIFALIRTTCLEIKIDCISKTTYRIRNLSEKTNFYYSAINFLKRIEEKEKEEIVEKICRLLKNNISNDTPINLMLNWDEIKEMQQSGIVSFGAHTLSHPILTKTTFERAKSEIFSSKEVIEKKLGVRISSFAYPNGNTNSRLKKCVKEAGFTSAFTTCLDEIETETDFFELARTGFDHENFPLFKARMAGISELKGKMRRATRNASSWMMGYILNRAINVFSSRSHNNPVHVFLCICDHFEPLWNGASDEEGLYRVMQWVNLFPKISQRYKDIEGKSPKYTFFFPVEEYRLEFLEQLSCLNKQGCAEVEIHLHHDNDTSDNLRRALIDFKNLLVRKHGLLSRCKITGKVAYGFIHGNWSLDNSRRDGNHCGVNNEIDILEQTGCFADFTLPSVPSETQTAKVNSIYYAIDNPVKPKSHNWGKDSSFNSKQKKGLLMIQGPLSLNWRKKKYLLFPGIESGELDSKGDISLERVNLWLDANVHIKGMPRVKFIKLHTHGCQEETMNALLTSDLKHLFSLLESKYNDGKQFKLHYVSAREMVNIIKAIEDGRDINDGENYRDYRYVPVVNENE